MDPIREGDNPNRRAAEELRNRRPTRNERRRASKRRAQAEQAQAAQPLDTASRQQRAQTEKRAIFKEAMKAAGKPFDRDTGAGTGRAGVSVSNLTDYSKIQRRTAAAVMSVFAVGAATWNGTQHVREKHFKPTVPLAKNYLWGDPGQEFVRARGQFVPRTSPEPSKDDGVILRNGKPVDLDSLGMNENHKNLVNFAVKDQSEFALQKKRIRETLIEDFEKKFGPLESFKKVPGPDTPPSSYIETSYFDFNDPQFKTDTKNFNIVSDVITGALISFTTLAAAAVGSYVIASSDRTVQVEAINASLDGDDAHANGDDSGLAFYEKTLDSKILELSKFASREETRNSLSMPRNEKAVGDLQTYTSSTAPIPRDVLETFVKAIDGEVKSDSLGAFVGHEPLMTMVAIADMVGDRRVGRAAPQPAILDFAGPALKTNGQGTNFDSSASNTANESYLIATELGDPNKSPNFDKFLSNVALHAQGMMYVEDDGDNAVLDKLSAAHVLETMSHLPQLIDRIQRSSA